MSTQHHRIEASWAQIASGPALIEATEKVHLHFGTEAPASGSQAYHVLSAYPGFAMTYGGSEPCWARANKGVADVVVTEGAL